MKKSFPRVAMVIAIAALLIPSAAAAASRSYIVMLTDAPVASYRGGVQGIPATSPKATGQRTVSTGSAAARSYRSYLADRQRAALARAGGSPEVRYSYRTAFAGFAARLTPRQVTNLRAAPQVAHVFRSRKRKPQSVASDQTALDAASGFGDTAAYLGLPAGLWNELGGSAGAGDDVIVGVIDTGITPQHPSFAADDADGFTGPDFGAPPARFSGSCDVAGDPIADTPAEFCNNKLIGARYFIDGFGADNVSEGSFGSPRDDDGHGTHTASTAAGNFGVDPAIRGNTLGVNRISGIAPRARVAAYKICWVGNDDTASGCTDDDSLAAIDAAVADGVDVINYSIGGTTSNVIDVVEYAFLGASDANVFVANSAGNSGPDPVTVGTPTTVPWLTSVAADNPARTFAATATIRPSSGPSFQIKGASVTAARATAPVADAALVAAAGATAEDAELCLPGTLDAAKVTGRIVLCVRGVNARIEKSEVVQEAGGVGMILYNAVPGQDTDTDTHYVPTVHVDNADGLKVKQAVAAGATTASLTAGTASLGTPKVLAAFSSRGPQEAVPDLAKPDVTAPGVNILAGNTPDPAVNSGLPSGELFQSISGTSMSSPQVAGAAALLRQQHPDWSPAVMKSALMLSADSEILKEDGSTPASAFDGGSGEIDPTAAGSVGLVLDENTDDYLRYLSGTAPEIFGDIPDPIAPSDLNLASISNSQVAGTFATTRTFTSMAAERQRWTVSVDVPGFDASAGVGTGGFATFNIDPGETIDVNFVASLATAPLYEYAEGAMTLSSADQTLRIPVTLRPIAVKVADPIKVTADTSTGSVDIPVGTGYTGDLGILGWGFAPAETRVGESVGSSPTGEPDPSGPGTGNAVYDVTVPAGAQLFSARISNADGGAVGTDLDLFVFHDANADGAFTGDEAVGASASAGSEEAFTQVLPDAGAYRIVIVGFATNDPVSTFDLSTWTVADPSPDDVSNAPGLAITGDPFAVSLGGTVNPTLSYAGVDAPGLYLGVATFHDSAAPSLENVVDARAVELTKTVDTTPVPEPTIEPTVEPTVEPTPGPGSAAPRARVRRVRLSGNRRTLAVRLSLNRKAKVSLRVSRKGRVVARSPARTVRARLHTERFRLNKALPKGSYRVRLNLRAGGKTGSTALRIKVR